nr:immunoglobulin light chain junction region [Macaca mulatta]MOV73311.1 immunoglobulin light chain junction region [Macaca mulatta]MOW28347.1 immunoglobulin light chain junction region [Macaca mulatta]MOW28510.1 immunoglobulin light chain junction region [Macaca mulatta]MOW29288.1 immunoglobulin light chain junction region [Macaca mulatta]
DYYCDSWESSGTHVF